MAKMEFLKYFCVTLNLKLSSKILKKQILNNNILYEYLMYKFSIK